MQKQNSNIRNETAFPIISLCKVKVAIATFLSDWKKKFLVEANDRNMDAKYQLHIANSF